MSSAHNNQNSTVMATQVEEDYQEKIVFSWRRNGWRVVNFYRPQDEGANVFTPVFVCKTEQEVHV